MDEMMIWNSHNVEGRGAKPPCDGFSGPLLITGSSSSFWNDLHTFFSFGVDCDVMCINHSVIYYPLRADGKWILRHAVAFDPDCIEHIMALRKKTWNKEPQILTHSSDVPARFVWKLTNIRNMAFSASFATAIGLAMGYEKIILAGCGQDNNGHFYDDPRGEKKEYNLKCYMCQWTDNMNIFRDKVKALSGNTMGLFGLPTKEWIEEVDK